MLLLRSIMTCGACEATAIKYMGFYLFKIQGLSMHAFVVCVARLRSTIVALQLLCNCLCNCSAIALQVYVVLIIKNKAKFMLSKTFYLHSSYYLLILPYSAALLFNKATVLWPISFVVSLYRYIYMCPLCFC